MSAHDLPTPGHQIVDEPHGQNGHEVWCICRKFRKAHPRAKVRTKAAQRHLEKARRAL